jgi:Ser/Thr protein kinase RdoA (MazF antagonist)
VADRGLAATAEEVVANLVALEAPLVGDLPRQLVHGDFWDDNVLFRGDAVAAVLDFDFMGERARIDDVALSLYYTNSTLGPDYTSADRLAFLRGLVDAYDNRLDDRLSPAERAASPLAIARTVLAIFGHLPAIVDPPARDRFRHDMTPDVRWAADLVRNVERWQHAFA